MRLLIMAYKHTLDNFASSITFNMYSYIAVVIDSIEQFIV